MIVAADVGPGHGGDAEAVVTLRYPNGAERAVTFTADALADALDHAGITTLTQLVGRPWHVLVDRHAGCA